jgi:hypothetical protein
VARHPLPLVAPMLSRKTMPYHFGLSKQAQPYGAHGIMHMATRAWHHDYVDREKAMTELLEAVADASNEARIQRTLRLAVALYEMDQLGVKQKDLVARTGLTRETIRRHIEDEKIRRGEIEPTARYIAEQERVARRRAARDA